MRKILILLIIGLLSTPLVKASIDHVVRGEKGADIDNAIIITGDQWYNYMALNPTTYTDKFFNRNSKVRVKLWFDDSHRRHFASSEYFTVTVSYDVYLESLTDTATLTSRQLEITYDGTTDYIDIDMEDYHGFLYAEVENVSVTLTSNISGFTDATDVPDDVHFDVEIITERYFVLDGNDDEPDVIVLGLDANNNELELAWPYVEGAESYDLEWVFVDADSQAFSMNFNYDFKNAIRVNTNSNHYNVSMAYPRGIFVFRARGVTYVESGGDLIRKEGPWSLATTGTTNSVPNFSFDGQNYTPKYEYAGLELDKNWQYMVTFAEQGKRKEVISFFDGSFKPRQTVTALDSDSSAIVGQTIYDNLGRGALSILPAPRPYEGLVFYENNTKSGPSTYYSATNFDQDTKWNSPDDVSGADSEGAGFYYSTANTNYGGPGSDYIPDAEGKPFTRVKYKADGTGRVASQSGIGDSLGVGSGHETRYFYGAPSGQEELDRLFGNEVGKVNQYKKNMVVDPNGSCSITYLDQNGHAIATAIAGDAPTNLLDIDTKPTGFPSITADLTAFNETTDPNALVATNTFLVTQTSVYSFTYHLKDTSYFNCGVNSECHYDLYIYLFDENGVEEDIDDLSGETHFFYPDIQSDTIEFEVTLDVGSYTIQKILKLHEDSTTAYYNNYITDQTCYVLPNPVTGTTCNLTCDEVCKSQFLMVNENGDTLFIREDGTIAGILNSSGAILQGLETGMDSVRTLIADCMSDGCPEPGIHASDPCEMRRTMMIDDMSPGGQYYDNLPEEDDPMYDINGWLDAELTSYLSDIQDSIADMTPFSSGTTGSWDWQDLRDNWDTISNGWTGSSTSPTFDDFMLSYHPEYCFWYNTCKNPHRCPEGSDASVFPGFVDLLFEEDHPYLSSGAVDSTQVMWNPTGTSKQTSTTNPDEYQPFNVNGIKDTLFSCIANLKGVMDSLLLNYTTDGSNHYSIWYILADPDSVAGDHGALNSINAAMDSIFNYLHGDASSGITGIIGNGPQQMSQYAFFRSGYLFFREYILYQYLDTACGPHLVSLSGTGYTADGFLIHYPYNFMFEEYNGGDLAGYGDSLFLDTCYNACEEHASQWMAELGSCIPVEDTTTVKNLLIEICALGCDSEYPFGNSEGNGVDSVDYMGTAYYTFQQVLDDFGTGCPPLTHPEPDYDSSVCECGKISAFVNNFLVYEGLTPPGASAAPLSSTYLETLLNSTQEGILTDDLEEVLLVSESYDFYDLQSWYVDCFNGNTPITVTLPESFECDSTFGPATFDPADFEDSCGVQLDSLLTYNAFIAFQTIVQEAAASYIEAYKTTCFSNMNQREVFTMSFELKEYHYTLFYFDQADNLIKTIPPQGVNPLVIGAGGTDDVNAYRTNPSGNTYTRPSHSFITNYRYNSLQQLTSQTTPDVGTTQFWYDPLGRLVVSQNAKQLATSRYSYMLYDDLETGSGLGRIVEAGQIAQHDTSGAMTDEISRDNEKLRNWLLDDYAGVKTEVTHTYYDTIFSYRIDSALGGLNENDLRNRITGVTYEMYDDDLDTTYDFGTFYQYDINGNVKTMVHDLTELTTIKQNYKKLQYEYDLVSGNVNEVRYQPGQYDEYYYRYKYDADNRLTRAYSSEDGEIWQKESKNFYYSHGPLARMEIGDKQVQALDYVYTVNGWLKTVNSSMGHHKRDAGVDGDTIPDFHSFIARDAYGFSLEYFKNDYAAVGSGANGNLIASISNSTYDANSPGLYNGNISKMIVGLKDEDETELTVFGNAYRYDQLNRIKNFRVFENGATTYASNSFSGATNIGNYQSQYWYDGNGNIDSLIRNGYGANLNMDKFGYSYITGKNQLEHVTDYVGPTAAYTTDIENTQSTDNYQYDQIGELVKDVDENIDTMVWSVTGKVQRIIRDSEGNDMEFKYDAMGQRVVKISKPREGSLSAQKDWTYTYYVRDAQGNPIAIYERSFVDQGGNTYTDNFSLSEVNLYGSKRLGQDLKTVTHELNFMATTTSISVPGGITETVFDTSMITDYNPPGYLATNDSTISSTDLSVYDRDLGNKTYELSNHLGNVLEVISDRKFTVDGNTDDTADYYTADIIAYNDYYPFGMLQPGRNYQPAEGHRYGFQGQEMDNEVKGNGNSVNYKYRMHDPRLGRFFAVDPLAAKYPYYSPYSFSGNRVVDMVELEGLEPASRGNEGAYLGQRLAGISHTDAQAVIDGMVAAEQRAIAPLAQGAGLGVVLSVDIFLTRGWLTKTYLAYQFGTAYEHVERSERYLASGNEDMWRSEQQKAGETITEFSVMGMLSPITVMAKRIGLFKRIMHRIKQFLSGNGKNTNTSPLLNQDNLVIWQDAEALSYLEKQGAEAAYMSLGNTEGMLILRPNASEQAVLEEIIHHNQKMAVGESAFLKNRTKFEIEAQDELLKIGKEKGWSADEMDRIKRAKESWGKKLNEETSASGTNN